jgi:hypothetical protein
MNTFRVLQYNVQKSKNGVMIPILDGPHASYDVIAIQEPWLNPGVDTTYCPRSCSYNLIFPQAGRARACLFINKRIPLSQWHSYEEPDYCRVQINLDIGLITIYSIYSEKLESYGTTNWNTPIPRMLEAL